MIGTSRCRPPLWSLDGPDAHLHILGDIRTFQPPNSIDFREGSLIIIGVVDQELPLRPAPQFLGAHQKQNTVDLGTFQKVVDRTIAVRGLTSLVAIRISILGRFSPKQARY